jgi:hypothetical protein
MSAANSRIPPEPDVDTAEKGVTRVSTTISRSLAVTILGLFVTGCSGGGAEVKSNIQTTTQGQQLLD